MKRQGFTLVELSIALVIIGLLIGGILVAQSMVASSKITSQVKQFGQFDAAITNYKTRYNCLASDCLPAVIAPVAGNYGGDNDGAITWGTYWPNYASIFAGEIGNFWSYIFSDYKTLAEQPGYVSPDYGAKALTSGTYKNVPLSKMGKEGSFVVVAALTSGGVVARPAQNFMVFLNVHRRSL